MNNLYPTTVAYIKKAYSKEQDINKLIKKIGNKYCISEQSARAWIRQTVGVG
ncbi:MAG TPA: hypothetical protein VD884_13250 [Ohtaekwangia sp.]|nr:hypothetical protein [Ohtaekwangia sp.]